MKLTKLLPNLLLLLLMSSIAVSSLTQTSKAQASGGSAMINGVLAHQMSASQAQLLASSNITWVSADVTFNPVDVTQWSQIYTLAKQYHLSLMGILDQHLMNYSNTFTLADWSNAVTQAVNIYGDVVKTWEIWNEPTMPDGALGYFDGSPQTYFNMLQTAYNDIKAVAPSDTVIGLGGMPLYDSELINGNETLNYYTQQGFAWATQVVQLGGMQYCDAVAVHAYPYGQYFALLAGAYFTSNMQQYQQLCRKPVWVTEVGTESSSTTWPATQDQQASFITQSYTLLQNAGAKAYFWYELSDSSSASNFGLFDSSGNPKEAWTAYVNAVNNLQTPTPTPSGSSPQNPTAKPSTSPSPFNSGASSTPTPTLRAVPEMSLAATLLVMLMTSVTAALVGYVRRRWGSQSFYVSPS